MRFLKCEMPKASLASWNWNMCVHLRRHIPSEAVDRAEEAGRAHTFFKIHNVTLWEAAVFSEGQETKIGMGSPDNFSGRWPLTMEIACHKPIDTGTRGCTVVFLGKTNLYFLNFWIHFRFHLLIPRGSLSQFSILHPSKSCRQLHPYYS